MDLSQKYVIYAGTARGALIHTQCKQSENAKYDLPEKAAEITSMEWGEPQDQIVLGLKDGTVKLYDTVQSKYVKLVTTSLDTAVMGLGYINQTLVAGSMDGIIHLWKKVKLKGFSTNLDEKGTLLCLKCNNNRTNVIGTGGESNDFKLWDVETQKCIFKAKSLGHDELNLPIPTSIRGICFFPGEERLSSCVTKEGHVLLYDDRAQRRPVVNFKEPKASYTTIATAYRERQCLVGTTRGYMQLLDIKAPGKCLKTFTTFTGSVTSIVCDLTEPIVATACLDRHLRILNLDTKEILYKEYMKQNLTKVLLKPVIKEEIEEEEDVTEAEQVDEEYEQLFESMETVLDTKKRKGEKAILANIKKKKKSNKV